VEVASVENTQRYSWLSFGSFPCTDGFHSSIIHFTSYFSVNNFSIVISHLRIPVNILRFLIQAVLKFKDCFLVHRLWKSLIFMNRS
jgi:hypothetical protein